MAKKKPEDEHFDKVYGSIDKEYNQGSILERVEALFLDNLGKIITREQIVQVSKNPKTGKEPENWHQRVSEMRVILGYDVLSKRDRKWLKVEEYLLLSADRRATAGKRVMPDKKTWVKILENANHCCEWAEDGVPCGLKAGEKDPIGGGTVKLTADHKQPHSINPNPDPKNPADWQVLCSRHQVMKKNYWDSTTGKMNVYGIIQAAPVAEKEVVFRFLLDYFDYTLDENDNITKNKKSEY